MELESLKAMVESLPEPYAEALILTELDGLTQKEFAEKTGIPLSGAKSRVQRAKKMVVEVMTRACEYELDSHGNIADYRCKCSFPKKNS